jgi:hypothetical protein
MNNYLDNYLDNYLENKDETKEKELFNKKFKEKIKKKIKKKEKLKEQFKETFKEFKDIHAQTILHKKQIEDQQANFNQSYYNKCMQNRLNERDMLFNINTRSSLESNNIINNYNNNNQIKQPQDNFNNIKDIQRINVLYSKKKSNNLINK